MCCFNDAVNNCCECKDDGTAALKQPFMQSFLDARAADFRKPMVGAIDFEATSTEDGGVKTVQVTHPLQYECIAMKSKPVPPPLSPLAPPSGDKKKESSPDKGKDSAC